MSDSSDDTASVGSATTVESAAPNIEVTSNVGSEEAEQEAVLQKQDGGGYFSVTYGNGIPLEKERKMIWSVDTSLLPNISPYVNEA